MFWDEVGDEVSESSRRICRTWSEEYYTSTSEQSDFYLYSKAGLCMCVCVRTMRD